MTNYKRFNLGLLLLIPCIFLVYFLSVYFFYRDTTNDSFAINTYFNFKEAAANRIQGNKILFTSGSNNFLGIRASQIEDTFKVPTINMSINAGLNIEYILDRIKVSASPGDIIIVPLEYIHYSYAGEPGITINKYLLTYDKDYFWANYNATENLKILSSISIFDFVKSLFNTFNQETVMERRAYFLKDLNKNGDMLNMTEHDSLKTKKNPFELPIPFDGETKGLKKVKEFSNYCKANDISLFVTFPNIVYDDAYLSKEYQRYFKFLTVFFDKNQIDVLGIPRDGMYPQELFFDSEYHLTSEGSDVRTKKFISVIKNNQKLIRNINELKVRNNGFDSFIKQ